MTEDVYRDEAAEVDNDPTVEIQAAPDGATSPTYAGRCHGGPWDTSDVESRFPKGFLLIHMPQQAVWIYDRGEDGDFYVRNAAPEALKNEGASNRWRAAEEANYDIRVLDPAAVEPAGEVRK